MAIPTYSTGEPIMDFFFTLFNGIAEVPLFSSPITGILILAGVFLASRKAGAMMVLSGLIGAGVALLAGAPYDLVTFGLFGYNSILTGMAFWSGPFVKANRATFFISVFGAAITAFTSSFIFTTWALMYASKRFGHDIWPAPPPPPKEELLSESANPKQEGTFKWTAKEFIVATLKGVSQVTFVENWKTGVFWVVGLTLAFELAPMIAGVQEGRPWFTNGYTAQWNENSMLYLAGLMALLGSGIGVAMAILTKLPTAEIKLGLHGFNQVLVMIALTSFVPLTPQSFMMAVFATIGCSFLMPGLQRFFGQWGLPALTGPFVFTAWIFLLATAGFQNIPAGIGWARAEAGGIPPHP